MDTVEKNERQEMLDEILNDEIDAEVEQDDENLEVLPSQDKIHIHSGEALSSNEFYKIAAKENTKLLIFVGPVACGKTTMETSIYQLFHKAPVGNCYFAGSKSLQGFEQRSFYTRTKSKADSPVTQRTSIDASQSFLHLRLWDKTCDVINNLILADLSGEEFVSTIGNVIEAKERFYYANRADYIVGIIDGEKLCAKKTRNSVVSELVELLRTFKDADLVQEECVLQIVISKYDLLYKTENYEEVINKLKSQISSRLSELFSTIEFYSVAAMPTTIEAVQVGYGLEELLKSWITKRPHIYDSEINEPFDDLSEFDKLYYKFIGEKDE